MNSEDLIMVSILVIVLIVGITGIFFTKSITGMASVKQNFTYLIADFVDIKLTEGDGTSNLFEVTLTPELVNPVIFDSFGNCSRCQSFDINKAPYDLNYAGIPGNNQTLYAVVKVESNTFVKLEVKINTSLPAGFNSLEITSRSFNNASTQGTQRFAFNNKTDGFDDSNVLLLTTSKQQLLGNWSDGTGFGGISEAISCRFSINPSSLQAGNYIVLIDYSGSS
jgi:hypothetical protein